MLLGELLDSESLSRLGIWTFLAAFVTVTIYKLASLLEFWAGK